MNKGSVREPLGLEFRGGIRELNGNGKNKLSETTINKQINK